MEVPVLPAERAVYDAVTASVVLGDPQGATADTARFKSLVDNPQWPDRSAAPLREVAVPAAQLVDGRSLPSDGDISAIVLFAAETLRSAGPPAQAAALCRSALDRTADEVERLYQFQCIAESAYRAGNYRIARQAFGRLGDNLNAGMVAQAAGDRAEAVRLYGLTADEAAAKRDASVEGMATARLGDVFLDLGDAARAVGHYDRAIGLLTPSGSDAQNDEPQERGALQRTYNNRGIAHLQLLKANNDATPDCSGAAVDICAAALADFDSSLQFDPENPVYLLNKGWAARLLGQRRAATKALGRAAEVDRTTFPALNDLGVLSAQSGDLDGAREAFLDALAANPRYDLALWNLGVLELQSGVSGAVRGQAYLARAIRHNTSFALDAPSYRTDDRIYRVEFGVRSEPGAGWMFGRASSFASAGIGTLGLLALVGRTVSILFKDKLPSWTAKGVGGVARVMWRRRRRRSSVRSGNGWHRWVPLLVTLPVLAGVTAWVAVRADSSTAVAAAAVSLFAALSAVIAHELGHVLLALRLDARVVPELWGRGILIAVGLEPLSMSIGPFPGQRVLRADERATWWVYLGGPLANLVLALGTYALYCVQPMPGLRLMAQVHLAAIAYALLPFEPMDGAALVRSRPAVLGALNLILLATGILFGLDIL